MDKLLVRMMIRWTGLAPWEFEFPFFDQVELFEYDRMVGAQWV